jgi:hypothetical protein
MAQRRRLSSGDEDAIIEAYQAWDPRSSSLDDLVAGLGIARQTLYRVIERRGVTLKSQERSSTDPHTGVADEITSAMSRQALTVLIDELVKARTERDELRAELEALRRKQSQRRSAPRRR